MDWRSFDKETLEKQYSPRLWSKRGDGDAILNEHIRLVTEVSNHVKATIPCDLEVPYGIRQGEKFDIFGASDLPTDAPVFVYIHGGYWQALDRTISSYCVAPLYNNGNIVVVVGYDLAPTVTLEEIVQEIQSAMSMILKWASERGTCGVVVGGHSAGSHLAAMLMHSEWSKQEANFNLIRCLVHISGVFDLTPLVETSVNEPLKLDSDQAMQLSPLHLMQYAQFHSKNMTQIVVVGENDPPEFQRQTSSYARALADAGFDVHTEKLGRVDHFDIVEKLQDQNYSLTATILGALSSQRQSTPK